MFDKILEEMNKLSEESAVRWKAIDIIVKEINEIIQDLADEREHRFSGDRSVKVSNLTLRNSSLLLLLTEQMRPMASVSVKELNKGLQDLSQKIAGE